MHANAQRPTPNAQRPKTAGGMARLTPVQRLRVAQIHATLARLRGLQARNVRDGKGDR